MVSVLLKDRNLVFLHVPKTGGGSISRVLRSEPDATVYSVRNMSVAQPCVSQLAQQLPKPLNEYRTVAFVRNPWDWTVSGYLHVTKNMPAYDTPPEFHDFLLGDWGRATTLRYPEKFTSAKAYVAYHTQITPWAHLMGTEKGTSIDQVCRFEHLAEEAANSLGITVPLPHVHKSERQHYSEYFDDETQSIVAHRHAEMIEQFGYQFERL